MKKKNENALLHGLLIIAVVLTTLVAIALGLIVSVKPGNPIKTVMQYIQNGFEMPEEGEKKPETDISGETVAEEGFDENDVFTLPEGIILPPVETEGEDVTLPDIVPPVIDGTNAPAEDTKAPSDTEKPTVKPPENTDKPADAITKPAVTEPPVTTPPSPPITPSDRVNDPDYFKDALFIGDSRTVGFHNYARIEGATYFGRTSMTVKTCFNDAPSETGTGNYNLAQLLQKNRYGKIYILLGINEIGYSLSWIENNYKQIIATLKALQPDAIIIIQSNMHVTKKKSEAPDPNPFKNSNIDALNARLATYADNEKVFYLDTTTPFDDAEGNLVASYSGDGVHFKGSSYSIWRDYILTNGKR